MRTFGRWGDLGFAAVVVVLLPLVAGFPLPFVRELGVRHDPYQYWFPQTIHQISQAGLTLVLMKASSRMSLREWGLNLHDWRLSLRVFALFCIVWLVPAYWLVQRAPTPNTPISSGEIVAVLAAHFVITGFTQEILFRGFVMTYLLNQWNGGYEWKGWRLSHAGILATLLFMLAHVKLSPFSVELWQLAASLGLGLYYAVLFERTKSLLGPGLSHNYSNGAYVLLLIAKHAR
jgi:membrane protease YdiL (CAAX protease family)